MTDDVPLHVLVSHQWPRLHASLN